MSEKAVNIIREIREKNIQQIRSMPFEERLAFINKKVERTSERLSVIGADEVKDAN
jgi:hypothetical protein